MIYGEGKSLEQIQGIVLNMKKNEVENILLTRVSSETYDLVKKIYPNAVYYSSCRLIVIEENPFSKNKGIITIFRVEQRTFLCVKRPLLQPNF